MGLKSTNKWSVKSWRKRKGRKNGINNQYTLTPSSGHLFWICVHLKLSTYDCISYTVGTQFWLGNVPVLDKPTVGHHDRPWSRLWWRRVILVAAKVKWLVVVIQKDRKCLKHDFCFFTPNWVWVIKMSSFLESIRTLSGVTNDLKVSLDLENQELISTNFRQFHQVHPMFSNGTCGKCNL